MAIDNSIYSQIQTPDILGNIQKGLSVRDMIDQKKLRDADILKQKGISDAYQSGITTNEDGTTTFNNNKVLTGIAQVPNAGKETYDARNQFQANDLAQLKLKHEQAAGLSNYLGSISDTLKKDPSQYQNFLNDAKSRGYDTSSMPAMYGEDAQKKIDFHRGAALSVQDQIANQFKQADLGVKQQEADTKDRGVDVQNKHYNLMYQDHKDARAQKNDDKQSDFYQKASKDLESFRGNQAVQQANTALTNVSNALSLANKGNLSPDQLHLFSSEMAKLATGGVPGHSEIEALMPNTLQSKAAKAISFFSNNPSDADAQAFIDNNKGYLKELMHNYGDVVDRYRNNTLNGYSKKITNPDYLKELQGKIDNDSYKKRFAPPASALPAPSAGTVRMQGPDGKMRDIPADQVGEAIASGGKKL